MCHNCKCVSIFSLSLFNKNIINLKRKCIHPLSNMALVFQETVNPDFVKYFAKMTFAEFRDIYSGVKDKQGVHSILKKTCKQFCKENPISRKFDFTKGKPWGRRVSVNGGCQAAEGFQGGFV